MIRFQDRAEAGRLLAERFRDLAREKTLVIALARGGIPVASEIARALTLPLDILSVKKIGAPGNPEFALGAVVEGGEMFLDEEFMRDFGFERADIELMAREKAREADEQAKRLRADARPPLKVQARDLILVDDGLATGSTMAAAIQLMRKKGAREIAVAVPVASVEAYARIEKVADRVESLITPAGFRAVSLYYRDFEQISDSLAATILNENRPWNRHAAPTPTSEPSSPP